MLAMLLVLALAWAGGRRASKLLIGATFAALCAAALSARFGAYFATAGTMFAFSVFPRPRVAVVAAGLAVSSALLLPLRVPVSGLAVQRP